MKTSRQRLTSPIPVAVATGEAGNRAEISLLGSERARRILFYLLMAAIALGAMAFLRAGTPKGLGIPDDGVVYIGAARNILDGHGYARSFSGEEFQPVTHYPPLFSLVLAAGSALSHYDPIRVARGLVIILWGLSIFLGGWWAWRMTGSMVAGLLFGFFLAADGRLLLVYGVIMSEPLSITLTLASFLLLALYSVKKAWPLLLAAGALGGLAYLTRYSGLALLATTAFALFVIENGWGRKIRSLLIYIAGALPFMLGWALRNALLGLPATNRVLIYHSIPLAKIDSGFRQVWNWLIPPGLVDFIARWPLFSVIKAVYDWDGTPYLVVGLIGAALLVWLAIESVRLWGKGGQNPARAAFFSFIAYIFFYLAAIIFSMLFFDASTPFTDRILAPVYIGFLAGFLMLGVWLWRTQRRLVQALVVVWVISASAISLATTRQVLTNLRTNPPGFAGARWSTSPTIALVKALPANTFIYSDDPEALYILADRPANMIPTPIDPVRRQPRSGFDADVANLHAKLMEGHTVLVIFDSEKVGQEALTNLTAGVPVFAKTADGLIFGKP